METTATRHIQIDAKGVPRIENTRTRVIDIVLDNQEYGLDPEGICAQHPHLTLAQVYAALSYYYDHQKECDADIERRFRRAELLRSKAGESPFRKKLRAMGRRS